MSLLCGRRRLVPQRTHWRCNDCQRLIDIRQTRPIREVGREVCEKCWERRHPRPPPARSLY